MNLKQAIATTLLAVPMLSFAAVSGPGAPVPPNVINHWEIGQNGDLNITINHTNIFITPIHKKMFFHTMMAANFGWPVVVTGDTGEVVMLDVFSAAPAEQKEMAMLATCGNVQSCTYAPLSETQYGCLLTNLKGLVEKVPGHTIEGEWPTAKNGQQTAAFTIPNAKGGADRYVIAVSYTEPSLFATITAKPATMPYSVMWTAVDAAKASCP
jgi:hypothetical protein